MATNKSSRATPGFIADTQSPEAIRRQFIDQPMAAARQPVLDAAIDLLGLMTLLPNAFAASQRREYERLSRTTDDEKDPRLAYMKLSLERAEELREMAALGQARIERGLVAVGGDGDVFHGFVQDGALRPRAGASVRISGARSDNASPGLSATTDKDGYFSIALELKAPPRQKVGEVPVGLSARMAELLDAVNRRDGQARATTGGEKDPAADTKNLAKVEIFDASGKLIHADPFPLTLDGGSAYREYVIDDGDAPTSKTPATGDDRKPPTPVPAPAPASAPTEPQKAADKVAKTAVAGAAKTTFGTRPTSNKNTAKPTRKTPKPK
jgi:hypothetical protein